MKVIDTITLILVIVGALSGVVFCYGYLGHYVLVVI